MPSLVEKVLKRPDLALVEIDRELIARGGLKEFTQIAWPIVEPASPLLWNWHHDVLCDHVQAVLERKVRNLLACVPPGSMKSLIVSVMASGYAWTEDPSYRILAISYADKLSKRDSRKVRNLITSDWYQNRWGDKFRLTKEDEGRIENSKTGFRVTGSTGAGVVGERGNLVLVDDPLSREQAESAAHRRAASEFFWETLPTRLNNYHTDGKIVIMQRLHEADIAGEILERAKDEWECLVLPNEFEPARRCVTSLGFSDPREEDGELLHEARLNRAATDQMKSTSGIGSYAYAGQFQQRPAPREGGLIKVSYLANRYKERGKNPIRVIQSWDCASKPKERNDPSVGITLAEFKDRVEVWDVTVKRQEFPDLLRRVKDTYSSFDPRPTGVLVEDKDAGQQLIQTLKRDRESKLPVVATDPEGIDKYTRMAAEVLFLEAGKLWLPDPAVVHGCEWVGPFVHELTTFPGATHDDQVDALSQALRYLRLRASRMPMGGMVGGDDTRSSPNRPD